MKGYGISFLGVFLLLAGCGEVVQDSGHGATAVPVDFPRDLAEMQGAWSAGEENRLEIRDRTIRLLFRNEETGQLYRRNVYIEGINEAHHSLDIRGEETPWHYTLSPESLSLRFYDRDNFLWVGSTMGRETTADQIANR